MCGQLTAYNTYATVTTINPLFIGFSRYLNVNKERFFLQFSMSYGVSEKYVTPRNKSAILTFPPIPYSITT